MIKIRCEINEMTHAYYRKESVMLETAYLNLLKELIKSW